MTLFRNITAALALGMAFIASAGIDLPTKQVNGSTYYYYEVPPKETIYSITRKFGITRDDIIKYNPQVIDGLRAGDTLLFPVSDCSGEDNESAATTEQTETPVEILAEEPTISPAGNDTEPASPIAAEPVAAADSDAINVAVMLPFMLEQENITRQAQNQTNFYRGALLAVDSLASPERKINLFAFDTEGSAETVARLMNRPELLDADFIIVPGDSLSIEAAAAVADTTGATVVNLFAVKNDAHLRHESVLQANIPHDAMYAHAIKAFCKENADRKVLILNATDIPAEKRAFIDDLTASLVSTGIPYEQIDYAGKLMPADLESLASRDYVAIPTSSSREALLKALPTLVEFAEANPTFDIHLFGYPEWVVLRGDIKEKLHRLNTTVYSRFSTALDGADVASVNNSYVKWFGSEPAQSAPDTMLLGFDAIAWILHAAANGIDSPYTGLQNTFRVVELDDVGAVNEALYLINFTRDGRVNANSL